MIRCAVSANDGEQGGADAVLMFDDGRPAEAARPVPAPDPAPGEFPGGVLTVAKDGSAQFTTIGAAIDALMSHDDGLAPALIRIAPGEYWERVAIRRPNVTLESSMAPLHGCGAVERPGDAVRIVCDFGAFMPSPDGVGSRRGTFRTATVFVDAHDVTLRNLVIANDAGPGEEAGQAVALYADGDRILVDDCTLIGHQDTLFTGPLPPKEMQLGGFIGPKRFAPRIVGRQCYRRCRILGDIDFIFGSARAFFEDCEIRSVGPGFATAASTPEDEPYGYVFSRCRFTATSPFDDEQAREFSPTVPDGSVALGRPWRDWAKVVLVDCSMGRHIRVAGWDDWGKSNARIHAQFEAINPSGPGAVPMAWPLWTHTLDDDARPRYERDAVLGDWRLD